MSVRAGLCSVTLRSLSWERVLDVAVATGLSSIEWGGDIHVPPGDAAHARAVFERCRASGIAVASYGSYFVAGETPQTQIDPLISTARALHAPRIRVWAGAQGSASTDATARARVVAALRELSDEAAQHGITVGLEYHGDTLTDSAGSTLHLLDEVDRPNLATYWQPPLDLPTEVALADLRRVLHRVCALHVFSWWPGTERHPLRSRRALWQGALDALAEASADSIDALLEFVVADDSARLATDARDLLSWSRGHRPPRLTE